MSDRKQPPRVGLVLGAGGVLGGAWLVGALHAIARETGWDPGSADYIVGTSAGSMIGALLACGVPPWFMVAHSAGEVFDGYLDASGNPASEADRTAGAVFRVARLPLLLPGSPALALETLVRPAGRSWQSRLAGWAPNGVISTEPLKQVVRRAVPSGWASHPDLWIVACDYRTGERVVFGRAGAPPADLADAVAASCAIPGFYEPVRIGNRRYVDGGMHSASNLDLVQDAGLDLVICLNPLSAPPGRAQHGWPHVRLIARLREGGHRRLREAARRLERQGTSVVVIEPTAEDIAVMGHNLMSRKRRHDVVVTAIRTVSTQVRRQRRRLAGLPPGAPDKLRQPSDPPSQWRRFTEAAAR